MTARTSRFPGFQHLTIAERRQLVADSTAISFDEIQGALDRGGLAPESANKFVENVIGTYSLPFGVVLNVRVNGRDYLVPMVVEEPSVIAAASNAGKWVRAAGGFTAQVDAPIMTCQIQLYGVADVELARSRIEAEREALLESANCAVASLVSRGGGATDLEVRDLGGGMLVVHVYVDCKDAMGANLVNSIAEALGDRIAILGTGTRGLRILSNLCDRRRVRVKARIPAHVLASDTIDGKSVIDGIVNASRFAEADPYRAATHNKGIMNGIDAVCLATGNDWRAVEAGAHAYAARTGKYSPLSTWRHTFGPDNSTELCGELEMPLAVGIVGGTLRVHPAARLALRLLDAKSATEFAAVAAAVGLCSNLAALRALATDGIQRGHMALHARAVAVAAGASEGDVEQVALMIVEARDISLDGAKAALRTLADVSRRAEDRAPL